MCAVSWFDVLGGGDEASAVQKKISIAGAAKKAPLVASVANVAHRQLGAAEKVSYLTDEDMEENMAARGRKRQTTQE